MIKDNLFLHDLILSSDMNKNTDLILGDKHVCKSSL